jgi:hypothetical protein
MLKTRVIACDIYGTVLCEDDPENAMPPRCGFVDFVRRVKEYGIILASTSDADNTNLLLDLSATFRGRAPFGPEIFDRFYRLSMKPKDYSDLLVDFAISPEELLVIGNSYYKDLSGAPASSIIVLVPTYCQVADDFDFSDLDLSNMPSNI